MKELFNNLQSREKSLLVILASIIILGIILSSGTNLYSNLQGSSQRLSSAKSDYDYVYSQAEVLSFNLAQKSFLLNKETAYATLEIMAKDYELINYVLTKNESEVKMVYILNDLESSLLFIEDSVKIIGITPASIEVSRLNEIKRFTVIFNTD
tara:strand:- start:616 stop:1074 length:459 start_codon:yes stop_codon:yes gene_type:complete